MKIRVVCLMGLMAAFMPVQGQMPPEEITTPDNSPFLIGVFSREYLRSEPYASWFEPGYESYRPNPALVENLKPLLQDTHILLFLGTWCGDSRREVPRLLRILDAVGVPADRLKMVGVDRRRPTYKTSPGGEQWGLQIRRVPTIIVLRNGREVGRIVERPAVGLEQALCDLLSCSPSVPVRD